MATAKLGRKLYEVPVGFKWFVAGLLDGALGFGGEESAGVGTFVQSLCSVLPLSDSIANSRTLLFVSFQELFQNHCLIVLFVSSSID